MSGMNEIARQFFEACETGKGWAGCSAFCHADATFDSQTGALAGIDTLDGYCEWMKNLFTPIPDGASKTVLAFAVFHGTQTGPGGPVPPTGMTIAADYVYQMVFDGDRIRHVTKIWNDTISMQQLGWA